MKFTVDFKSSFLELKFKAEFLQLNLQVNSRVKSGLPTNSEGGEVETLDSGGVKMLTKL